MMSSIRKNSESIPLLSTIEEQSKNHDQYSKWAAFTVFFFPALGGLLFGYDIGATSAVLEQLVSTTLSGVSWSENIESSSVLQGTITSGAVLGAMFGSLLCFKLEQSLGRRKELLVSAVLYVLGAAIEGFSGIRSLNSSAAILTLVVGRIVYGMGSGFAMHGAPAYIGEMSPPSIRGVLVGMKEAFIVLGILIGYICGYFYENSEGGWRSVYFLAIFPALFQFWGMWCMPPSARWLVLAGRRSEARKSIAYVTPYAPESVLDEIEASLHPNQRVAGSGIWELWQGNCRPALVVGVGLVILQQITGQPSVLYYADSIFADVGLSSVASILTGTFKLAATLFSVFNADKLGRKKMLSVGCWFMLTALVFLSIAFMFEYVSEDECNANLDEASCSDFSSKCSFTENCVCGTSLSTCTCCGVSGIDFQKGSILAAMFIYIGGYQVGFGPMGWLVISEIFPLELRGRAISVAVVANFAANLLVTFTFPIELDLIGGSYTFFIFALLDMYAIYFIASRVPETKGMTLEQIERLFNAISHGRGIRSL